MASFFKDEPSIDIAQFSPRTDPVLGRASSPTNGAMWYDTTSNSFHGIANGTIQSVGGGASGTGNLVSFIQTTFVDNPGASQISFAAPSISVTSGDLLFCVSAGVVGTFSDSLGSVFTQVPGVNVPAYWAQIASTGNDVITLKRGVNGGGQFTCAEYSGPPSPITLDVTSFNSGASTSFWTTTSAVSTTATNELVIGFGFNLTTNSPVYGAQSPFILRSGGHNAFIEDAFQATAGPTAAFLVNGAAYTGSIGLAAFKLGTEPNLLNLQAAGGPVTNCLYGGANCFNPQNYPGWHGNGREVLDASWSGGGNTITCPNNDCNFTPAMNGWLCWAMPQSMQAGPSAPGTLTFVSPQSATCTASAVIGSAVANGDFNWGQDDTPAWVAATNALFTQPKCGAIVIPAARSLISQGLSYTGAVVADCSINVVGAGYSSNLVLEPGFNAATVTNNVGCTSLGCFWNTSASTAYLYFNATGTFQSLSGVSTAPASSLFTIGPGSYAIGVNLVDWASAASNGPKGANINGSGPFGLGFAITNWGDGNIWNGGQYGICQNCGGSNVTLKVTGASLMYDYSGTYNGLYANGGELHGYGSLSTANSGGFGAASCDKGSLVYFDGAKVGSGTPGANGIGFQFNNLGSGNPCVVHARGSLFNGGGSGAAINVPSGVTADFFDDGGNTFSTPFLSNAGTFRNHHKETGTCVFAASTTCTANFAFTFGNSTLPSFLISPINPGAVTFTVTSLSTTSATITASSSNSLSVGWLAELD